MSPSAVVRFSPDSLAYTDPQVDRRVAIVTGGNSGIGWFTVLHLYLHGYIVYIGGRNKSRVEIAIQDIKQEAAKRRDDKEYVHLGELKFLELDLLDLKSVEKACKSFKMREKHLHLLVNNAGVMALPHKMSQDGFEVQFQTNYIGPFLFTERLIPLMTQGRPRILYISSIGHHMEFVKFPLDATFNYHPNILFTWFRYGLSKTSGIHYTKSLTMKHPDILSLAVHPGFVMSTNLFFYWTRLPIIGLFFYVMFQIFGWFFGVSNETGCYSTIKCALDENLTAEKDNGKYFATYGIEAKPSKVASNMDYAAESYIWTIQELAKRGFQV